jgi:5-formyltetrahydrofolate cyclo-ligase
LPDTKKALRTRLRRLRADHAKSLPASISALMFLRPPVAVANLAPEGAIIGLYHAIPGEAPTRSYAQWFRENGRPIALPWFADKAAPMQFRAWADPFTDDGLEPSPHGGLQPSADAPLLSPDLVLTPLVGFTATGQRLGQGGGHYDRWLAANPSVTALGLAWDCQLVDTLPAEPHDIPLRAIITPSRLYGEL